MDNAPAIAALADATAEVPRTALEAAQQIRVWHDAMRALSAIVEVRVLAAAWRIRQEFPERERFEDFVTRELAGIVPAERAWLMAQTWEVAQRHRSLREFAQSQPTAAVEFVREFVDAGRMEQLELIDERDERLVELLAAPPRLRRKRLRELLHTDDDTAQDGPPAIHTDPAAVAAELRKAINGLRKLESDSARLSKTLVRYMPQASDHQRSVILSLLDLVQGSLDTALEAKHKADQEASQ